MKFSLTIYFGFLTLLLGGCATVPKSDPLSEMLSLIKQQYVDEVPDDKLISGCRDGINHVLSASPYSTQLNELKSGNSSTALRELAETIAKFNAQFPDLKDNRKLKTSCMKGITSALDKQSAFLDVDEFKELTDGYTGGSIGIEYSIVDDFPRITSVLEDSPAERVGLETGDIVTKIDLISTKGISKEEVLKLLRGAVGSRTSLTIKREGVVELIEFALMRDTVRVQSVKWKSLDFGFAYIRVARLQSTTTALFAQAIEKLYLENGSNLKGLILDLRNNPGGLLTEAIAIPSAFLPSGTLVANIKGRGPETTMRLTSIPENYSRHGKTDPLMNLPENVKQIPLVVLINKGTCSGAEIIAAALQDHKRARLIGTRTFAQGRIATIFPLDDKTALKLTTAKIYRPSGTELGDQGVAPDMEIEANKLNIANFRTARDIQFNEALRELKH